MSKKPALGLSITDTTLEVLALGTSSGKYYISGYGWSRLPNGVVKNGRVVDTRALAVEIKKMMVLARPKPLRGRVVLGLPQSNVFLKVFTLPKFEGKDLEEAISWHVGSLSPVIPEDAYISCEIVGKGGNGEIRVLLAATQKEVIDTYLEALTLAGVEIAVIEPIVIAKARLINPEQLLEKSVVSLHLYGGILTASILVNGKVWFSRESFIAPDDDGHVIKLAVTEIVSYFTERKEKDVPELTELLYSGDSSSLKILEKNLININLGVRRAEAGVVLEISSVVGNVETAIFAPVLGLALRGRLHQKGMINLLPQWFKQQAEATRLSKAFSFWLVMVTLLIWLGAGLLIGIRWWLNQEYLRLEATKNKIEFDQKKEQEFSNWRNQFNSVVKNTKMILTSQIDYGRVLSSLAALTPKTVRITAFVYRSLPKREWSITGLADRREDVLVFDRELKNSEIFNDAQLFFSSLDSDQQVVFRFIGGSSGH